MIVCLIMILPLLPERIVQCSVLHLMAPRVNGVSKSIPSPAAIGVRVRVTVGSGLGLGLHTDRRKIYVPLNPEISCCHEILLQR